MEGPVAIRSTTGPCRRPVPLDLPVRGASPPRRTRRLHSPSRCGAAPPPAATDPGRRAAAAAGRGKRRAAACARRLGEVRDREIAHELRWNRCAELAVSLELTAIEGALLTVVSMYCVTGAFVCWETRAALMAMARIKTKGSFAAAVATLMRHGLLVPVDGALRTAWYLGEAFWGGLLTGEELDTPVAKLVRGRKRARERAAGPRRAGQKRGSSRGTGSEQPHQRIGRRRPRRTARRRDTRAWRGRTAGTPAALR